MMKKLFVLAVSLMMTLMANAQASVQAGFMLNTLDTEIGAGRLSGKYKGFMLTGDYNIHFTDYLGVAPGLGIDYSFNNAGGLQYKELGLLLPIDVNYRIPVGNSLSLSIFVGPTLYYGLFAKEYSFNPPYDYYEYDSKRFDVSLGGGVWLDIVESIRVKVGYKFGLLNTSKIDGIKEKASCFTVSIGYVFGQDD